MVAGVGLAPTKAKEPMDHEVYIYIILTHNLIVVYKDIEKRKAAAKRHYRNRIEWFKERDRNKTSKLRLKVLNKISNNNIHCVNCGCNIIKIIEINHINGGGAFERYKIYKNDARRFYRDILHDRRKYDDLDLRCKVCNILYDVELRLKVKGFKVVFNNGSE